ncbi:MAG TPA: Rieske 2Fe-2S domain-containing protein [Planctomycetaceae bacterium]|nr:Rieske 2Fe-2S domain-containing protein [Planctomycetaceae bacterium]
MAPAAEDSLIRVGPLAELERQSAVVVSGRDRPIAVFVHDGHVRAVDNRCPHMGFPLHRGTVHDGLLTCHWHEARFDLASGCTFDLWADDVPAYDTRVEDGVVYVVDRPRVVEDAGYYRERLRHGLEHGISLIQAKGLLGWRRTGADWRDILREIAVFGGRHHDQWGEGMTLLAVVGNLLPLLSEETAYFAVLRASRQVAADCSDAAPHRRREPLSRDGHPREQLARWMRHWVRSRHRDGTERVLLTALAAARDSEGSLGRVVGMAGPGLADIVFTAASDRIYSATGHVFDFANKAFELLDVIGWDLAGDLLPLAVPPLVSGRGAEENAHWHQPVDVVGPLREAEAELDAILERGRGRTWNDDANWKDILLGDDPAVTIGWLAEALASGAPPAELSRRVAWAAAARLARFAMSNEVGDWFNPRHTWNFANAVHQAVKRSPTAGVVRGIFHAALSVYMDRFLNVPAARLPEKLDHLPRDLDALRCRLLAALDRQAAVDEAAALALRYLRLGHPAGALFDTLTLATVREDLDFHAIQALEAGVQQSHEWAGRAEVEQIVLGVVRQLAAFCPTPRADQQTATIALRLDRGDRMYEEDAPVT